MEQIPTGRSVAPSKEKEEGKMQRSICVRHPHFVARNHFVAVKIGQTAACFKVHYRVSHLLVHLGWVDFDCECSPVCLILPGLMGIWQKRLIKMGKLV